MAHGLRMRNLPGPVSNGRPPVTFSPDVRLGIKVYLALGADLTADPSTWALTEITPYVRYQAGITCTTGRTGNSDRVNPGSSTMMLDNRDGRFTRKNPTGPYYGLLTRNTPILVEVNAGNGGYRLVEHFVTEWPPGFDTSSTDFYVTIRAAGALRRLQQNNAALRAAVRRAILGDDDLAQYWPLEDAEGALTFASALGVGSAMGRVGTVTPAASDASLSSGTDPLPTLATGTSYVIGSTSMASSTEWTYFATYYWTSIPVWTAGDGTAYPLYVPTNTAGTLVRWIIYWNDADNTVYLEVRTNSAVVATVAGPTMTNSDMINAWITFWVSAKQNGSDVDYAFGVERTTPSATSSDAASGTISTQTVRQVDGMLAFNGKSAADTVLGHIGILSRALTVTENTPCYGAFNGYTGEGAVDRMIRLCAEEGVPLVVQPGTAPSTTMGPQSRAGLLDNLRECEDVDGGALYETGWGLGMQPLSARYNLTPALRLDYSAREVNGTPRPDDSDLNLVNSAIVSRSGGSSSTYTDADSVTADDLHERPYSRLVETDDQVVQAASWLVHLGTQDEVRWLSLPIRLDTEAGRQLIQAWVDMGWGQRVLVSNVPSAIAGAARDIDVIVEGWTQRVDQFTWAVSEMATSPARSYDVVELDSSDYGRLDTDGSTLVTAINTTETALSIATTDSDSPIWIPTSVGPAEFPFDIEIGGERMTVTAVVNTTSPQDFTVIRSVNGIVKAHSAGAPVMTWTGAVLAR